MGDGSNLVDREALLFSAGNDMTHWISIRPNSSNCNCWLIKLTSCKLMFVNVLISFQTVVFVNFKSDLFILSVSIELDEIYVAQDINVGNEVDHVIYLK